MMSGARSEAGDRTIRDRGPRKIALIGCVKSKADGPRKAAELYLSPLFRKSLAYAHEVGASEIWILSARHGLIPDSLRVAPYEQTLNTMIVAERRAWAERVREQLSAEFDLEKDHFLLLAGERYLESIRAIMKRREEPLRGMSLGKRLQFLNRVLEER